MVKVNFDELLKQAKTVITKHSPEILTGIGVTGMITTTVLAVKATPKALMLIEERKLDQDTEKLSVPETVSTVWKCYIPTVVTGAASIACIIGASSINLRRNAALAAAYTISETALKDYKEKVIETVGEKKETEIHDKAMQTRLDKTPLEANDILLSKRGDSLFFDAMTGRYFRSDIENVRKARNELNNQIIQNTCASLNDFYSELNIPEVTDETKIGDILGWNIRVTGTTDIRFSTMLAMNDEPCVVIDFTKPPVTDYYELF